MKKNTLQFLIIAIISCSSFSGFSQIILNIDNFNDSACSSTLGNLGNVLSNDSFDGNTFSATDFIVNADSIYYFNSTNTVPFITLDSSGNILNSNIYFIGSVVITYSVYRISDGTFSTSVAQCNIDPPATLAVNDSYAFIIGETNSPFNILQNDKFCGIAPLNRNFIQWNLLSTLPQGVTFDMFGEIAIDPTTNAGVYNIQYEISNLNPVGPQAWSQATLVLAVTTPSVNAVSDVYNFTVPASGGYACTGLVTSNDTINLLPIPPVLGYPPVNFQVTIPDPNILFSYGEICFTSSITPGTYNFLYTICNPAVPGLCSTATVTVNIVANNPSNICMPLIKDTMIHEYETTRNYGTNTVLQPSRWTYDQIGGNGFYTTKTLQQFDLSAIPTTTTIASAFLTLRVDVTDSRYFEHQDDTGGNPAYGNGITVNEVATAWNENTVTWNTAPSVLASTTSIPSLTGTADVVIDLTSMIQNMITIGINNGLMLSMTNNADYYHSVVFGSRENTSAGGIYQPELCINLPALANEQFVANAFMVYPNPANEIIKISGKTTITKTEVFDLGGKLILSNNPQSENVVLNIGDLSNGMYLLKISSENRIETKKIFKN